jgi:IS605 OrfB family transposase
MAPTKLIRTDDWLLSGGKDLPERTLATAAVYQDCVWRLCGIILTHWPKIGKLDADKQPLAVERLFNRTKANPRPRYARFFESRLEFRTFPSYLRRAAIRATVGQVSSFLTRYDKWQTHQRRKTSDRPPTFGRPMVWPVLYTANGGAGAMARFEGDKATLKLWSGKKWAWFPAVIVRRGSRHEGAAAGIPQSPMLKISRGRVVLTQPFQMPRYSRLGDREVVLAADLGINKTATAAIVASDGSVRKRMCLHRTQHDDRRDKAAVAVRGKARKTMGGRTGNNHGSPLEARIAAEVEAIQTRAWEEILRLAPDLETSADQLGAILGRAKHEAQTVTKRLRVEAGAGSSPEKGEKAKISKGSGKLSKGFCAGLYARIRGLNLAIARDTARSLIAFARANGATVIVLEHLKGWRPKVGGKGGAMKARFHHWLHRALVKQVEASFAEQGGRVAFVSPWGTSAWAYDGSGKVTRPTGSHDLAVFATGKRYDADLNAAYNIGAKYWVGRLAEDNVARGHLAAMLGWDDAGKKTASSAKAAARNAAAPATSVDNDTPPPPARRKNGGAVPGRRVPRSRGPRTAPRAPATLSTLWHLARAMQLVRAFARITESFGRNWR